MIRLDEALLVELGLGFLSPAQMDSAIAAMYSELQIRVGTRLAGMMSDDQLNEFEHLIDEGDEQSRLAWLQSNYPDYRELVREEYEQLCAEVRRSIVEIRSAHIAYS